MGVLCRVRFALFAGILGIAPRTIRSESVARAWAAGCAMEKIESDSHAPFIGAAYGSSIHIQNFQSSSKFDLRPLIVGTLCLCLWRDVPFALIPRGRHG